MPHLGDISYPYKEGKLGKYKIIWLACVDCGKERWVSEYSYKQGLKLRCVSCGIKKRAQAHTGVNAFNWKGGRTFNTRDGYWYVLLRPDNFFFPMATRTAGKKHWSGAYVREHRLVMANHLKRCLLPWEVVHHRNGNKLDNRKENLHLTTAGRHDGITKMENKIKLLEKRVTLLEAENVLLRENQVTRITGK